jgi:hypothetical protein
MTGPMPSKRSSRFITLNALLFGVALFGYPLVGNLISLLQIDSRIMSVPFRVGVGLFGIWIMLNSGRLKIDRTRMLMILIWILYGVRLLNDWFRAGIDGADYAFQFFIACSVIPAAAAMKSGVFDSRRFAVSGFLIAGGGSIMSLLATILGGSDVQYVTDASGRLSLAALDPVSLGNLSVSAILCGAVLWRKVDLTGKVLLLGSFLVLLWCLILTGSKGPAIALVFCLGFWAIRRGFAMRLAVLVVPLMLWIALSSENPLAARISASEDDQSTADRFLILSDSLNQIALAPWTGSAFVELNSGYYPHNIFIEAGLALGVPMALVFIGLVLVSAWRSWKALGTNYDLLGLLFIQSVFAGIISGAIFGATLMWVTMAIMPKATVARESIRKRKLRVRRAVSPASLVIAPEAAARPGLVGSS